MIESSEQDPRRCFHKIRGTEEMVNPVCSTFMSSL